MANHKIDTLKMTNERMIEILKQAEIDFKKEPGSSWDIYGDGLCYYLSAGVGLNGPEIKQILGDAYSTGTYTLAENSQFDLFEDDDESKFKRSEWCSNRIKALEDKFNEN